MFDTSQIEGGPKTVRYGLLCNLATAFCHITSTGSLVLQYADRNRILSRTATLLLVLLSDILRPFWWNVLLRAASASNRVVKRNPKFLVYSWKEQNTEHQALFYSVEIGLVPARKPLSQQ